MAVIKVPRDKPLISVPQSLASEEWLKIVYLIDRGYSREEAERLVEKIAAGEIRDITSIQIKMDNLPDRLKRFIENTPWTFTKTYTATWPHEYIVREKVDQSLFSELAEHIDKFGYLSHFYKTPMTYYDFGGYTYWHMDNIINRCLEADTYHRREKDGRLPK
jgi:hypothetical protein